MKTHKKCRGTGLALGHGCGKEVPVERFGQPNRIYGLGKSCGCYMDWLLNTEEGQAKIKRASLENSVTKRKLKTKQGLIKARSDRELSRTLHALKEMVHSFVRIRDRGKPCISCKRPWNPNFQAGHYFKAELYSWIKFHLHNINGQCPHCNLELEGNPLEYGKNLPDRIGKENFDALVRLSHKSAGNRFKWDLQELREEQQKVKEIIKQWKIVNKS